MRDFIEQYQKAIQGAKELAIEVINGDYNEARRKETLATVQNSYSVSIEEYEVRFESYNHYDDISYYCIPQEIVKGAQTIEEYWNLTRPKEEAEAARNEVFLTTTCATSP